MKGNRYPHVDTIALSIDHHATFQVSEPYDPDMQQMICADSEPDEDNEENQVDEGDAEASWLNDLWEDLIEGVNEDVISSSKTVVAILPDGMCVPRTKLRHGHVVEHEGGPGA